MMALAEKGVAELVAAQKARGRGEAAVRGRPAGGRLAQRRQGARDRRAAAPFGARLRLGRRARPAGAGRDRDDLRGQRPHQGPCRGARRRAAGLADDSGIAVEALGGAPGVHTADWAETPQGRDYGQAMERVWRPRTRGRRRPRAAPRRLHCALSLAWPDGHDETFLGTARGRIVWPPRGANGFGFDPIFLPDGHAETFGEMDPAAKHAISHRADAFRQLVAACFTVPQTR
jgi:non-canonical purine NTP pyrophosphatase (RdgB/HAM1 family)